MAGEDWIVAEPETEGLDPGVLSGLVPQFAEWPEANIHAALIARNGKLVFEQYFAGEDWAFATPLGRVAHDAGTLHDLRSVTKSVTSLLVGIAIARGWLASVDMPVFDLFPEHTDLRTPANERLTLRHLLTMSAGFAWSEALPYSDPANSERLMMAAEDRCRYVLSQPVIRPPGATYAYNGGLTALLAAIVARAAGRPVDVLAEEALFTPLGIEAVEWVRYADGAANAVSGLRLRPRDMLRIGQLVLDRGVWRGRELVPTACVDEATTPAVNGEGLYF